MRSARTASRWKAERVLERANLSGCRKPLIERAFEMARSGAHTRVETIERALCKEGYPRASPHWNSGTLRKQLRQACLTAVEAATAESQP